MATPSTVVGLFQDRRHADEAVDELKRLGFDRDHISVVARGREGRDQFSGWDDDDRGHGDDVGPGQGAAVGGLAGLLIGAGLMLIPGVGPIFAVGPLAAGLAGAVTGAVAGAVTGGIAAGLIDLGVPEEEAGYYESRVGQGAYLVTVNADGRATEAREVLLRHGAEDMGGRGATAGSTGDTGSRPLADTSGGRGVETSMPEARRAGAGETVQLREEELAARKERVQSGEVEVRKEVVEEQRTIDVPVQREEVFVERRPAGGRDATGPIGQSDQVIEVPVMEEQVSVEKRPVVTEEIRLGKREVQDTEQVSGTVRREEARVETSGDVQVGGAGATGAGTSRWEEAMPRYRNHWQESFGNSGERWEDYEPSYQYVWQARNQPQYRGRAWNDVEPDVRRDWESRHRDKPWDRVKDGFRSAWERVT